MSIADVSLEKFCYFVDLFPIDKLLFGFYPLLLKVNALGKITEQQQSHIAL